MVGSGERGGGGLGGGGGGGGGGGEGVGPGSFPSVTKWDVIPLP